MVVTSHPSIFTIFTCTFVYPPKILHNHCLKFLLGNTVVIRKVEDNGLTIFLFFLGGGGGGEG